MESGLGGATNSSSMSQQYPTLTKIGIKLPTKIGCVQSLLPLFSVVSSSRLTSYLGIDSINSRALSQGTCRSTQEFDFHLQSLFYICMCKLTTNFSFKFSLDFRIF
ncbi:hypothetical protein MKX03_026096 [Papaver bracteatum]|nr:hypothetical protein MKX03_026096 [Papaver bracteatum]